MFPLPTKPAGAIKGDEVMRTRYYDALTNDEIVTYLRRSDVIFLPVGAVEMHGEMPVGCEHVLPLAFALQMAEAADGLVLPHLAYFFAGATAIGKGTITVRPRVGGAYLMEVCRSLLRQGFRRQVLLSAHGPAGVTVSLVVREFFEKTKCPIGYVDLLKHLDAVAGADFSQMMWGAYHLLGRLDEIPREQRPPAQRVPPPEAVAKLLQAKTEVGYYYSDESHHGWWPEGPLSDEERLARAEAGARQIEAAVAAIDPRSLVANLKDLDRYVQHHVLPKFGEALP
jgi:creatinine amidohydrolase